MSLIFSTIKKRNGARGMTLIESIFYMVLLILVTGVLVQTLVSISGTYRKIKVTREIEISGTLAMEEMLREIKNASSIDAGGSILGANPGALALNGTDEEGDPHSASFNVSSGVLEEAENGGSFAQLTSNLVRVNSLVFRQVTGSKSAGVRIELELMAASDPSKVEKFYGFAVLRGSY